MGINHGDHGSRRCALDSPETSISEYPLLSGFRLGFPELLLRRAGRDGRCWLASIPVTDRGSIDTQVEVDTEALTEDGPGESLLVCVASIDGRAIVRRDERLP